MVFFFKHVGGSCCFGIAAEKQNKTFLKISLIVARKIFLNLKIYVMNHHYEL